MFDIPTSSTSAYDLLRSEILHGNLMPGDRLRVTDLSTRFGIGLTPLREALVRLTSEGLVHNESNRGAWVREISTAELHDLFSTRRQFEALCLRRALTNRSPEWEAEILRSLHLLSRAPVPDSLDDREGTAHWEHAHRQFHLALISACNSEWRLRFWHILADQSERYRKLRLAAPPSERSTPRDIEAEHQALATAALDGQEEQLVSLMDSHLAQTEAVVTKLLQSREEGEETVS